MHVGLPSSRSRRAALVRLLLLIALGSSRVAYAEGPDGAVAEPTDGGVSDGAGDSTPETEEPSAPSSVMLSGATIDGNLLEPAGKLMRFLGLQPGATYGLAEAIALPESLERLGYTLSGPPELVGSVLRLHIRPLKIVRTVRVKGNFPLFDDEILRHVAFTSGTQLPPDELLETFLHEEAQRVGEFLGHEGYFGNTVTIERKSGGKADHEIDLIIRVDLGGWAKPFKLDAVRPQGNRAITDHELLDLFSHGWSIWGRFSLPRMREDARRAEQQLKDRGYPAARVLPEFEEKRDTDPARRRVSLPLKVSEKRRVDIHFIGNRELAEHDLREQLTIFTTGAYDEIELEESARSAQRYYQQHGFFEARVTFRRRRVEPLVSQQKPRRDSNKERDRSADVEEITFLVEEGPELRVREVEAVPTGAQPLMAPSADLMQRAGVETKPFPRLGAIGLGSGGYVTAVQLKQDEERLVTYYRGQGFPGAKVRTEVARDPSAFDSLGALGAASAGAGGAQDRLYVRFYVDEGKRELCDHIEVAFVGEHKKTAAQILKLLKIDAGGAFTEELLADDARRVAAAYKSLARPYVQVDFAGSTWNSERTRITVRFRITEGPEVRFGEIVIRGNFTTHDRVIMQDLPFRVGDPFDLTKLEEGERNLQTHFIFASVRLTPVGLSSQKTVVPILVSVRERYIDYGGFLVSAGVSSDRLPYYAYVSASYIWSNFFGFGSQLELRGDFGFSSDAWGFLGRYSDPRVFGPKWRFDATGFYRREVTNRLGPLIVYGASLQLTRFLTNSLRGYLRYENYLSQTAAPLSRLPGSNDRESEADKTHTAKLSLGLVWDHRVGVDGQPNPLAPYKGWMVQGLVGWAFPSSVPSNGFVNFFSSENNFLVLAAQAMFVQPFTIRGSGFSFLANLRYDQGIPFDSPALPAVERYFAGGDTATRGYEPDELKVETIRSSVSPLPGASGFQIVPQGGNIRMLSTVEIQFPIARTFLGLPFPWVGAVFYDAGAIFDAWNVLGTSDIKHAIGLSFLRLQTPIGAISVEYAYPLIQGLAEERWKTNPWYTHFPGRIHFNWGIPMARF